MVIGFTDRMPRNAGIDNAAFAPLGAVIEEHFEWGNDRSPAIHWSDTIIYETHVKGLSRLHPDVAEDQRGTYLGLVSEPILEHLLSLGVTTIQLLPVHAKIHDWRLAKQDLSNYWGYNTLAYFAPEPEYSSNGPITAVRDFKMMVRALHAAGLEVIVDVAYNHTGESNHLGPTLGMRGIDNMSYYKDQPNNPRFLMDYSGTGNTLDVGNPYVLQLIMDSLRYWVQEMHVDGFRFDLAASLARDLYEINMLASFFKVIQQDPVLSQVKLIAEPWDVGPGGYQVGSFPWQWTEWNGRYRDAVRRFWRRDHGLKGEFATRVAGSSDLYERSGRRPFASINFITSHDGFTLEDQVSYMHKHNFDNQEGNRDGHEPNFSMNCGVEGPSDIPEVIACRDARKRSMMATLLLSQGAPMILGGDELSRTQRGNNNAYCQDNEVSWYDWTLDEREEDFFAYVKRLIAFRKAHPTFRQRTFLVGQQDGTEIKDALWWHPEGHEMANGDWSDETNQAFGLLLRGDRIRSRDEKGCHIEDSTFLLLFNSDKEPVSFSLPNEEAGSPRFWFVVPEFETDQSQRMIKPDEHVTIQAHSLTVLQADQPVIGAEDRP